MLSVCIQLMCKLKFKNFKTLSDTSKHWLTSVSMANIYKCCKHQQSHHDTLASIYKQKPASVCFGVFSLILFWCAPFGYLYFCYICVCYSQHCLHPSSIRCLGSNPRPLDHEPSTLTTRPVVPNHCSAEHQCSVCWSQVFPRKII